MKNNSSGTEIAIIGMSCHFPGAKDVRRFWENLKNGVESISVLEDIDLLKEGEDADTLKDPAYVKANSFIEDKEYFDSAFFNFRPDEAALMDPQIRKFFEVCWSAVEDAGYSVPAGNHKVGLFAGGSFNPDWVNFVLRNRHQYSIDDFTLGHLSNVNFLCSSVSNAFDFQGPSIYLDTACSTSLAAVQKACMSLLLRECNMALAGGVTVRNFSRRGYRYQDGMILSKDGHCRTFDAGSSGTVSGEGAGVVVLKRLKDAIEAGDHIYAVIKGSGINNDGASKMSFTAPAVDGQHKVIVKAIEMAGVAPESIGYIEAHGTGTVLGDPIEIEALNLAFGKGKANRCAIGSVKSNIGHLDIAAGIAGLLKTALAIRHRQIPPSLHFKTPNSKVNFHAGPFYVNTDLAPWSNNGDPLRAGVSSFGIGGTNVHVIVEEAPASEVGSMSRGYQLLLFSAKSPAALERNIRNFSEFLATGIGEPAADIAFTLQVGRAAFSYRKMIVCKDNGEGLTGQLADLGNKAPDVVPDGTRGTVAFLFPDEGLRYENYGDLYATEAVYRKEVDACTAILERLTGSEAASARSELFITEYALARLLIKWGILPDRLVGRGVGEYVAACIRGDLPLEDALALVTKGAEITTRYGFSADTETVFARESVVSIGLGPETTLSDLLSGLGRCWVHGITPDWGAFYEGERRKRVSLPTYSFDKIEYPVYVESVLKTQWATVRTDTQDKNSDISGWAYFPSWQLSPVITTERQANTGKCILIFTDKHGVGAALSKKFAANNEAVVVVESGSVFFKESSHVYFVHPGSPNDFVELYEHLHRDGLLPDRIIHCWGLTEQREELLADRFFGDRCDQYFFSVTHLLKAADNYGGMSGKKLVVVANGLHGILDSELIDPAKATVLGLLNVVAQEYPGIITKHIDVSLAELGDGTLFSRVFREVDENQPGSMVAFRHSRRWEQTFRRVQNSELRGATSFRKGGVYLITGGLGSLGFTLATRLLRDYQVKLVLLGRTIPGADADEGSREKAERLKKLESESDQVYYIRCNVAEERELAEAVASAEKRFGAIRGVIHAAGIVEGDSINTVKELEKDDYLLQFEPKVKALHAMRKVFGNKALDFCVLTSSLSPILGGFGLAAYASANGYMDYFVRSCREKGELTNWISVNVDGINFKSGRTNLIDKDEVFDVIGYSLAFTDAPQLVISATDLCERLRRRHELQPVGAAGPEEEGPVEEKTGFGAAPAGSMPGEAELLKMWQKFFGDPDLEAEDDFFEIGGNSLKAVTMIGRIKSQFNVSLKVKSLFEHSTVRSLSAYMMSLMASQEDQGGSLTIPKAELRELYALSPAQARCLFLHEFDKTSLAYNLPTALLLTGELDKEKLSRSFRKLIERHESLRTSFPALDGKRFQRIGVHVDFELEYPDAGSGDIERIFRAFVRPFDLGAGRLIRVGVAELKPAEHLLLIDMHHIATDGVSEGLLLKDFMTIYNDKKLPGLQLQYKDYAQWQQSDVQQKKLAAQKEFWLNEFAEAFTVLDLPTDRPRPDVMDFKGGLVDFELSAASVSGLKAIAEKEGATLFMVLLAVFNVLLSKLSNQEDIIIGTPVANRGHADFEEVMGMFINTLALRNSPRADLPFQAFLSTVRARTLACFDNQSYPYEHLIGELKTERDTSRNALFDVMFVFLVGGSETLVMPGLTAVPLSQKRNVSKFDLTLSARESGGDLLLNFEYATSLFEKETIGRFIGYFKEIVSAICADVSTPIRDIQLLPEMERDRVLKEFNDTRQDHPADKTVVDLFREEAAKRPHDVAVIFEAERMSYGELDRRSDQLAAYLRGRGVKQEELIPICVERSLDMLVGIWGILKAGAAYVPVDPEYPGERIAYMLQDTGSRIAVSNRGLHGRLTAVWTGEVVALDEQWAEIAGHGNQTDHVKLGPGELAYVLYTSGSTGRPKGVMVEHDNLLNFVYGMDKALPLNGTDGFLAITSLAFDIAALELIWTSCRGIRITLNEDSRLLNGFNKYAASIAPEVDFSLFYFSSGRDPYSMNKYDYLLRSVAFADNNEFSGVWLPERHFHEFGGIFPNPAVLGAGLATVTRNLEIRAGSVVLPLNDVIRVAEEWSVVDNLSQGRVSLSIASGWHADDFVLMPENYRERQKIMYSQIAELKALWKGQTITRTNGLGKETQIKIYPRPVSEELSLWVTSGGNTETFRSAGRMGAKILTHMLGQRMEDLNRNIAAYKQALAENGHPADSARVALMMHTYIGTDTASVKTEVKEPFKSYLRSNLDLVKNLSKSLDLGTDPSDENIDGILDIVFERYWSTSSLMGTEESCADFVERLSAIGVTEIACLIDFGVEDQKVLDALPLLNELRKRFVRRERPVQEERITAMQITPSYLEALVEDGASGVFLRQLRYILVGGERLPEGLLKKLAEKTQAAVYNEYGPTETTIWSTIGKVKAVDRITAGRPILNTNIYVVDALGNLCGIGMPGEILIGGKGVARGYLNKAELTAEKFVPNPFGRGGRLYKTGDIGRWMPDGELEIRGRKDDQVKIRGYRIEPGEIESLILAHPTVKQAVVTVRLRESGDKYLAAYYVSDQELSAAELRSSLRERLPEYMVPSFFVKLIALPLTANGKLDRKALPEPGSAIKEEVEVPITQLQRDLVRIWAEILELEEQKIGININFFDIGGNSLKLLKLVDRIKRFFNREISIAKLFFFPTVSSLAEFLSRGFEDEPDVQADNDVDQLNNTLSIIESENS